MSNYKINLNYKVIKYINNEWKYCDCENKSN